LVSYQFTVYIHAKGASSEIAGAPQSFHPNLIG